MGIGHPVGRPPEWDEEGKVMRSARRASAFSLIALTALLLATPGFAQELPAEGDPFSGVAAVGPRHMSAVSGLPGGAGRWTGPECGAGCGTAAPTNFGATTTGQVDSVNVNVTAFNTQTSIVGSALIDTSGGLYSAGGGN